jgi:hypothetical protein
MTLGPQYGSASVQATLVASQPHRWVLGSHTDPSGSQR